MMQRNTKKKVMFLSLCLLIISLFSGCGKEKESVTLSVWGAEEDQEMLREMVDSFEEKYKDEAEFNITICVENEVTCKETVLIDPERRQMFMLLLMTSLDPCVRIMHCLRLRKMLMKSLRQMVEKNLQQFSLLPMMESYMHTQ